MWLQLCIKNACISHIQWTRASLTRDSSHCLFVVYKLFFSGITSERMRFALKFLHSPFKECNIYVSIDLRTIPTNGWFYIEHTFHQIHHFLLPWSFYSFHNEPFIKQLHILSFVSTTPLCDPKAETHFPSCYLKYPLYCKVINRNLNKP